MLRRISSQAFRRTAATTVVSSGFASTTVRLPMTATQQLRQIRTGGQPPTGANSSADEAFGATEINLQSETEVAMEIEEEAPREPAPKPENPPKFITYSTDADGITTVKFNRAPVNSFNLELIEEFCAWIAWMGDAEEVKAVIIGSNINNVFSAGLDISELYPLKEERFTLFWSALQLFFKTLHTFPKPLIAAINGNAPAAGCITALGCDYRVMAKHPNGKPDRLYRIGLNETKLGLVAPPWSMASLGYVVGKRRAEKMLQLGETPTGAEALAIGLIDELVEEEEVIARATAAAKKFLSVNNQARAITRDILRGELLSYFDTYEAHEQDIQFHANIFSSPEVQKTLEGYLANLKGGK